MDLQRLRAAACFDGDDGPAADDDEDDDDDYNVGTSL